MLIKENGHRVPDWRSGRVLEVNPDSKGIVRQVRFKTANRDNIHRVVHQLVPLLPEEKVKVDNIEPSPGPIPTGSMPITRGRAKQKRGIMVQVVILLCLSLLPAGVTPWSVDPVMETRVVDLGSVQVKAFDLKYTISTLINFTRDLELISQQLEKF